MLAVGNALGEGIVIRDGLFTSETAEDQDGQWKWIRFSAAASPGNSGGPLLDSEGKVIGVVIGKSPNENLNYSLPIGRVLEADRFKARFDQRELVSLPYLHGTYTYAFKDSFSLPLSWPDFVKAYQSVMSRHNDEARATLLKTYGSTLFPKGEGSDSLLYDAEAFEFRPRVIMQQADGIWGAHEPAYTVTDLSGDGSVSVAAAAGVAVLRLIRSDAATDDGFYADSKAFMDLALKALNLRRRVGSDQVRVTSLGAAQSDVPFSMPTAANGRSASGRCLSWISTSSHYCCRRPMAMLESSNTLLLPRCAKPGAGLGWWQGRWMSRISAHWHNGRRICAGVRCCRPGSTT